MIHSSVSGFALVIRSWCLPCLLTIACVGQSNQSTSPPKQKDEKPQVNWLYGAYVPKEAPLLPLTGSQRWRLFLAQTFTTPGIYIKTAFLSAADQANGEPSEWGGGMSGYGRRVASRHGQSMIQNSFSALGNAALRYEPRYDRCRCTGKWRRTGHAILRNFVTYNRTEKELRPQFALYGAALGSGMISSTWNPGNRSAWTHGANGVLIQVGFGSLSNLVGEFAPEIRRLFKRKSSPTEQD